MTEPVEPVEPGLIDPVEPVEPTPPVEPVEPIEPVEPDPFDGLPTDIIDNDAISQEKLKEYLDKKTVEDTAKDKRVNDLRAKLSKKDAPENADGYFFKSEKFDGIIEESEVVQTQLTSLKERCHAEGMGQKEFEFVANELLSLAESEGMIDTRSKEEIAQWKTEEKAKLGDNAQEVIDSSVKFVDDSKIFNEEEKDILKSLMNQGAGFVSIVNKMQRLFGDPNPIPVGNEVTSGLKSDAELYAEYMDPKTTQFRCKEITQQRAKAGRKGKLSDARDSF